LTSKLEQEVEYWKREAKANQLILDRLRAKTRETAPKPKAPKKKPKTSK